MCIITHRASLVAICSNQLHVLFHGGGASCVCFHHGEDRRYVPPRAVQAEHTNKYTALTTKTVRNLNGIEKEFVLLASSEA